MKIGGFDISMSANIIHQDVDVLLRLARIAWPNGVIDIEDYSVPLSTAPKMHWPIPSHCDEPFSLGPILCDMSSWFLFGGQTMRKRGIKPPLFLLAVKG